jgi:hypothetical protein
MKAAIRTLDGACLGTAIGCNQPMFVVDSTD